MKSKLLLLILSFFSFLSFSQTSSGILIIESPQGHQVPTTYVATDLFANGVHTYTGSITVNEDTNYGSWIYPIALSVEDYFLKTNNGVVVLNNPGDPTIFFNGSNEKLSQATLYNSFGQALNNLKITKVDDSTLKTYTNFNGMSTGVYILKLTNEFGSKSIKLLNNNASKIGISTLNSRRIKKLSQAKKQTLAAKSVGESNYNISWAQASHTNSTTGKLEYVLAGSVEVEVQNGSSKNITITSAVTYSEDEVGDLIIFPKLNGFPQENVKIKIESTIDNYKDSLVSGINGYGIFDNIPVLNLNNPTPYKITLTHLDKIALETIVERDMFQGEFNNLYEIDLTPIPNDQDLTVVVRDHKTLDLEDGATVELINENTNATIGTELSENGYATFENVPENIPVHTIVSKAGHYTKTNGTHSIPEVDKISKQKDTINVTSVQKFNYELSSIQVAADTIQMYKPLAYNTEFILGHWNIFFPASANRQLYVDHFEDVETLLGTGNIDASNTAFGTPTAAQIAGYIPYPQGRQVYTGQIGSNITNYTGTSTGTPTKNVNGNSIIFYTSTFDLGGFDWSLTDHEIGNALGFPTLNGNTTTFKTSRDTSASDNVSFEDSKHDKAIMPLWLKIGERHFNSTDSQNRLIEYSLPTKFEE